ncbi:hypothetical protein [Pseudoroseicyclus sp. CXY001]|uniref:hypothetical protein n=1 Tax=Pseudoroseicyclus sp. CXY001 TaxID=3242492 RepID=UPI003571754C
MLSIDRAGSLAALLCAATYVFGFAYLLAVLMPGGFDPAGTDAVETLASLTAAAGGVRLWYFVIYIVNALALAVLATAIAERITRASPGFGRLTFAFGIVWTTLILGAGMVMSVGLARVLPMAEAGDPAALLLWQVVELVENGLGGGNELAGGAWALAIGFATIRTGALPRLFGWVSVVIGLAGFSTLIAPIAEIGGSIFGLGYILWFVWVGVALLRR